MKDPQRLIELETGERLRLLLSASDVPGPPSGALERTLLSLGLATAAVTAPIATASAATGSAMATSAATLPWTAVGKWLALGLVVGGGSSAVLTEALRDPPSSELVRAPVTAPPSSLARPAPPAPSVELGAAQATSASPANVRAPSAATPPVEVPAPAASTLADEIAHLDRARRALTQGVASQALGALDAYAAEFPNGQLGPEAALLRVRAYAAAGRADAARALAERLLLRSPGGDYAARVREAADMKAP